MATDWDEVFDLGKTDPADLLEHFERAWYDGREYRYLSDARHGVERGTAILDGVVVRGYPSIPRALVLDPTVPEYFDRPVVVEEKLDGYNVRVARVDGDLLAFTRSGYVCPYTTQHVRSALDPDGFFEDHPEQVLCGELVGPENPYTSHDYPEVDGVDFYVFDVRHRETGDPMAVQRRRDCCVDYDLAPVRQFGVYTPPAAVSTVERVVRDLSADGREGVVLKSTDGRNALKYTTSAIHRSDLAHAFSMPYDYGRQFVFSRVMREAFQAAEFGESTAVVHERARKLGEAILPPAVETVRAVQADEPVGETHTVSADPDTVEALLSYFREQGLELAIESDERVDGERRVTFTKVARSTRDRTQYYLDGGTVDQ